MLRSPPAHKRVNILPQQHLPPAQSSRTDVDLPNLPQSTSNHSSAIPISSSPPPPNSEIQLQAQIRHLTTANKGLKEQLMAAQDDVNSKDQAICDLKSQWETEKLDWDEVCDSLQFLHNFAHLKTKELLDIERIKLCDEVEGRRQDNLQSDFKDHNILVLQIKQRELEEEIDDLQYNLDLRLSEYQTKLRQRKEAYQAKLHEIQDMYQIAEDARNHLIDEYSVLTRQKADVEAEFMRLGKSHADLVSKHDEMITKFDRAKLTLKAAESALAEKDAELKEWQKLEKREGRETEDLRSKKVELELHVKELEAAAKTEAAKNKAAEKEREGDKKDVVSLTKTVGRLEDELAAAAENIADLQAALEEAENRTTPPVRKGKGKAKEVAPVDEVEDQDLEVQEVPPPKARATRKVKEAKVVDEEAEAIEETAPPLKSRRPKAGSSKQAVREPSIIPESDVEEDAPIELDDQVEAEAEPFKSKSKGKEKEKAVVEPKSKSKRAASVTVEPPRTQPTTSQRGKTKAKPKPNPIFKTVETISIDDEEDEEVEAPVKKKATKEKKTKAAPPPDEVTEEEAEEAEEALAPRKKRKHVDDADDVQPAPRARSKAPAAKAKFKKVVDVDAADEPEEEEQGVEKKKKRKIALFNPTAAGNKGRTTSYQWEAGADGGVAIPTDLSPIKAPQRSFSGRGNGLGTNSFPSLSSMGSR